MPEMKKRGYNSIRVAHLLALAQKQDGELQVELTTGAKHKILPNGASGSPDYCLSTKGVVAFSTIVGHEIINPNRTDSLRLDSASFTEASIYHCDSYPVRHFDIDKSTGFARFIAPIAKVGNLVYLDESGKPYTEFVPESTIIDSIDSFKGLPVTLNHPSEMVTASNARKYQRGMTHSTALYHDGFLWMSGSLTDDEIIKAVTSGRAKEISPGYLATVKKDGNQLIQAKRIGNHVSAVQAGRNGREVSFRVDSVSNSLVLRSSIAESELPDIPKELQARWV